MEKGGNAIHNSIAYFDAGPCTDMEIRKRASCITRRCQPAWQTALNGAVGCLLLLLILPGFSLTEVESGAILAFLPQKAALLRLYSHVFRASRRRKAVKAG